MRKLWLVIVLALGASACDLLAGPTPTLRHYDNAPRQPPPPVPAGCVVLVDPTLKYDAAQLVCPGQ